MTKLTVEMALEQIRAGRQIVLVDDEDRENEGDLCMAATKARAEDINFMARHGRGLICLTLTRERVRRLGLPKMSERNESRFGTNFHVSIEARDGVTTGISAADRATTIHAAVASDAGPHSIVSPGHVFPICAMEGGVLVRTGQTEGSVDLARLAGLEPAGVICEIMNDDGTMARRPDLERFAQEHGLGILTIAQLIEYRLQRERLIHEAVSAEVVPPGLTRPFRLIAYRTEVSDAQYLALVCGPVDSGTPALVRMHRAVVPADVFGVSASGSGSKNLRALRQIEEAGAGVFVYVVPGRVDLVAQVERIARGAAALGGSAESHPPELRDFGLGAQVLLSLGLKRIRLMTDNPKRLVGLEGYGLEVVEQVSLNPS
ncbi:MAG: 3,4-dihydroxy-2-butanone-4-phosphate synthase [Deltaproteobacteria bacterium]|nr:3,4-dihydroxy-2-butanone-4-phosphate synthase [Deltaproteobacteria bacterium]